MYQIHVVHAPLSPRHQLASCDARGPATRGRFRRTICVASRSRCSACTSLSRQPWHPSKHYCQCGDVLSLTGLMYPSLSFCAPPHRTSTHLNAPHRTSLYCASHYHYYYYSVLARSSPRTHELAHARSHVLLSFCHSVTLSLYLSSTL